MNAPEGPERQTPTWRSRDDAARARLRLLAAVCLAVTAALRAAGIRGPLLWAPVTVLLIAAATHYYRRRTARRSRTDEPLRPET